MVFIIIVVIIIVVICSSLIITISIIIIAIIIIDIQSWWYGNGIIHVWGWNAADVIAVVLLLLYRCYENFYPTFVLVLFSEFEISFWRNVQNDNLCSVVFVMGKHRACFN